MFKFSIAPIVVTMLALAGCAQLDDPSSSPKKHSALSDAAQTPAQGGATDPSSASSTNPLGTDGTVIPADLSPDRTNLVLGCTGIAEAVDTRGTLNPSGSDGHYYGGPDEFNDAGRGSFLKLTGGAIKWRVETSSMRGSFPIREIEAKQFQQGSDYVVPFNQFVPQNEWRPLPSILGSIVSFKVTIRASALDGSGRVVGNECDLVHEYMSPLVLNLTSSRTIQTIHPDLSKVLFDLNADGAKERTGWIYPTAGFLALDINGNGVIDNGGELFGQFTAIGSKGRLATNGYEALAQYDLNHDGVIDDKDPIFSKLVVWIDENVDGISQPGEVRSLQELGISKISVDYQVAGSNGSLLGNRILFESKFWGPSYCGLEGCKSFDIFFGTRSSQQLSQY